MTARKRAWNAFVTGISADARVYKRSWTPLEDCKMAAVMIEFRAHPWLHGVLHNMCHIYGGDTGVALVIVHGNANKDYVERFVQENQWENVTCFHIDRDNISVDAYSELLTEESFWSLFPCEFALIFQTDTLICKQIPEDNFQYDYVGAPWPEDQRSPGQRRYRRVPDSYEASSPVRVGNGGFSLRRVEVMRRICARHKLPRGMPEDVFFAFHVDPGKVAPIEVAAAFSVEVPLFFHPFPCGMHGAFHHVSDRQISDLLQFVEASTSIQRAYDDVFRDQPWIHVLRKYGQKCASIAVADGDVGSMWALIRGLSENSSRNRKRLHYVGFPIQVDSAERAGVDISFHRERTSLPSVDLLFGDDSWHLAKTFVISRRTDIPEGWHVVEKYDAFTVLSLNQSRPL